MVLAEAVAEPRPLPSPERRQALLFDAAREGRCDMIEALLAYGASIEAHDANGHTPLILAAYNGHVATVDLLLDRGADPDRGDLARGNTALMGVAFKGHSEVARRLVAGGCTVDARNRAGQTALMMAAMFGRADQVTLMLQAGAEAVAVDAAGNDATSVAAAQGNAAMVELLAKARAA